MVGCAGIPQDVSDMAQHEKMMAAKRRGVLPALSVLAILYASIMQSCTQISSVNDPSLRLAEPVACSVSLNAGSYRNLYGQVLLHRHARY